MKGIVVLGMHRSGTSAVTRVVNLLGAAVPPEADLLSDWDNPDGHWESRALVACNDRILGLFGRSWDFPPRLAPGWERSSPAAALVPDLEEAFGATFPDEPWVWKDPRTCLTLPLWRRVLRDQVCVVLVLRSATAVSRSIHRRDGIPRLYAAGLWLRYLSSSLDGAKGLPTVCVHFEEFQLDPRRATASLSSRLSSLGFELPGDVEAAAASVHGGSAGTEPGDRLDRLVARLAAHGTQVAARLPEHSASFDPPPLTTPSWVRPLLFCYRSQWALRSRLGHPLGPVPAKAGVSDPATTSGSREDVASPIAAAGSVTRRESDSRRAGRTRP